MKKAFLPALCLVMALCMTSLACRRPDSSGAAREVTLNFVGVNNVISESFLRFTDELKQRGITIDFQQFTNELASNRLAVSFAAGGGDIDVFMIRPLDETKLFIQNGWLERLDSYIARDPAAVDMDDFFEASLGVCMNDEGNIYALPLMVEGPVIFYNKKIFAANGITRIPQTMAELMDVARRTHDPANDIAGFASRGRGNPSITMFSCFLRAFGGDFFDANGNAAFNTPEALEAIQFYGDILRDYGPRGVLNMAWPETMAVFTQGKAAMRLDADTNIPSILSVRNSALEPEDIGYFKVPVGPRGHNGTFKVTPWAIALSPYSQNKDAAWEVVKWVASKEIDLRCQLAGGSSARKSTWAVSDANTWPPELIEVANESAIGAWPTDRPFMINVAEARTELGEAIVASINGEDFRPVAARANIAFQRLLDSERR